MGALISVAGGMLSRRLTVLSPTRTKSATGGFTTAYEPIGMVSGAVSTPRGRAMFERIRAEQPTNVELVEIAIRDSIGVTTDMRLQDGSDVYDLVAIERASGFAWLAGRRVTDV